MWFLICVADDDDELAMTLTAGFQRLKRVAVEQEPAAVEDESAAVEHEPVAEKKVTRRSREEEAPDIDAFAALPDDEEDAAVEVPEKKKKKKKEKTSRRHRSKR